MDSNFGFPVAKSSSEGSNANSSLQKTVTRRPCKCAQRGRFAPDSLLEGAGFEPSVPRESNGEKAKEPVSLVERKVPEMSSTGRRLSIFTSGFSRD